MVKLKADLQRLAEAGHDPAASALGALTAYQARLNRFIVAAVWALKALEADTGRGRKVSSMVAARMRRDAIKALRKVLHKEEAMGDEMPRL